MSRNFPVRVGEYRRYADVQWNSDPAVQELLSWTYTGPDPRLRDASDFAVSVIEKWRAAVRNQTAVTSFEAMEGRIADHQEAEVAGLLFARGSWPRAVGLSCALFHRTWSGNLYLDFLLSNPRAAVGHERVHGSSFWVLLRLCELADALGARFIWGETTELSCGFYRKAFGVRARDLLLLTAQKRKNFVTFLDGEVRPRLNALPEEHGR